MRRRAAALVLPGLVLAGCGFRLRGAAALPFQRIALLGFPPRSPLESGLRDALEGRAAIVARDRAQVILRATADERGRTVVASTAAGQVREVQLRLHFGGRAEAADGRALGAPIDLELRRDLSYSESAALAKQQEEAELFRAMQADVVAQVLRRLEALAI